MAAVGIVTTVIAPQMVPVGAQTQDTTTTTHPATSPYTTTTTATTTITTTVPAPPASNTLSGTVSMGGFTVPAGQRWRFDPNVSTTVSVTANVVVQGTLEMRPAAPGVTHTLRFTGVNEANFVGGGDVVLASDVGLWVVDAGQLDVSGAPKADWTRAAGTVAQGATSVTLEAPPAGWAVGDEITIAPTESPAAGSPSWSGFDERTITAVSGNTVSFGSALSRPHPMVNSLWRAEVANLTRNVRIEGTPSGRSHVWIKSSKPQTVNNAALRWMGPNKVYRAEDGLPYVQVMGRYPLHFHRSYDGSRGSVVDGTVVRDSASRAFVPHESNGVTLRNCVAYNVYRTPFWTDPETPTDDTMIDGCMAAKVKYTNDEKYRLAGFNLREGNGNTVRNSVAVGMAACDCDDDGAGFAWHELSPARGEYSGVWSFSDNVAHNNSEHGIFVWQNTGVHVVRGFVAYHNSGMGIEHGAYENRYQYLGGSLYGNLGGALQLEAVGSVRFQNMTFDGAGLSDSLVRTTDGNGESIEPVVFEAVTFKGQKAKAFDLARKATTTEGRDHPDVIDVVGGSIQPNEFYLNNIISPNSRVRVQPNPTTAYELRRGDQAGGTYVAAWNAKRYTISPFPMITITAPLTESRVSGLITLTALPVANGGTISRVEYFRNGGWEATDTTSPYSVTIDTRTLPEGSISFSARAYRTDGSASSNAGVTVFVDNVP